MMETYAERLQKRKEEKMSNYDMDEIERKRDKKKKWKYDRTNCTEEVKIDLSDKTFMTLALKAHEEDITFNHLVNIALHDLLKDSEYQFENGTKPQLLKEY